LVIGLRRGAKSAMMEITRAGASHHLSKVVCMSEPVQMVVWDFDCTIANSMLSSMAISNALFERMGCQPVELNKLQPMDVQAIFTSRIPWWKRPTFMRAFWREQARMVPMLEPFDGLGEVLSGVQTRGIRQGIVSSNSERNIEAFLALHNMRGFFQFIASRAKLAGKAASLKKVVRAHRLSPDSVLYIGDENRDIKAARQAGVRSALSAWGLCGYPFVINETADFVLNHPHELLGLLVKP
jgi:phosphoglycolate phosphatase